MIKNTCKLAVLLIILTVSSGPAVSQNVSPEQSVRAVLDKVFDAMRAGDSETLAAILLPEAPLDRIAPNQPVHHGTAADWIGWVDTLKPGQADEQIFDVVINVEGPLATAWAPFTIAIDGEMKSCGVNHFTLVKMDGTWKIAYLIDTHTPEKCPTK